METYSKVQEYIVKQKETEENILVKYRKMYNELQKCRKIYQ